jgi:hypothetical protein
MQNVYTARRPQGLEIANFYFNKFNYMLTIIGKRQGFKHDVNLLVNLDDALANVSDLPKSLENCGGHTNPKDIQRPKWVDSIEQKNSMLTWLEPFRVKRSKMANTYSALKELEKWVPAARLAIIQVFFLLVFITKMMVSGITSTGSSGKGHIIPRVLEGEPNIKEES